MHKNPLNGRIYIFVIIFLAILIQQYNASNFVNEEIVEPTVLAVELVTPKALNGSSVDFQQNLINIQQSTFIEGNQQKGGRRKNGARRRRFHSVSRSVNNSFRSHLATGVDGTRRMVDSGETSSSVGIGVNKYERTMLTNEGIERAIILVPSAIDHPKVLTAETFGSGKNTKKFNEAKTRKRQRIVKRVDGETSGGIGIRGNEYSSLGGKSTVTEQIEGLNASRTTKQQQMPIPINTTSVEIDILSNDLHLSSSMAARLRRFNKANLLKWPKSGRGNALVEYIHKVGLLGHNEHFNEKPQISFAIDDDRLNAQKEDLQRIFPTENGPIQIGFGQNGNAKLLGPPAVNLRTKFPKNRETQRPIRLGKADDSDMDLLSPPSHSPISDGPFKPLQQHFPNHRQQFIAAAPNLTPPTIKHHFAPHSPFIPPISPSISILPPILQTSPRPPPQSIQTFANTTNANAIIGKSSSLPLAQTTTTNSLSPNAKLELCCRRQNLPQTCQQFCNFDTFTQEKLLVALLGTQCPANQLGKAFDCAHSKVDHSECCQRHGIHLINGGQCMVFCRTHIKTPPNVLGYVSCLSQFGTIKNCYRDHQLKYRNLFGD